MARAQQSRAFLNPPRWLVPWITRLQVWAYERSNGRVGGYAAGMRHICLRTIGRRSGRRSTVCLPIWLDEQGRPIVVASYGGGPRHPGWYHNLSDRRVNPEVFVRDGARLYWAEAEVLEGEERERIWERLVADRPFYARYQAMTTRRIPLVRLIEKRPAEA